MKKRAITPFDFYDENPGHTADNAREKFRLIYFVKAPWTSNYAYHHLHEAYAFDRLKAVIPALGLGLILPQNLSDK